MSDSWEEVAVVDSDAEGSLVAGFLESHGIEVRVDSRLFHQEPVQFGLLGAVHLMVPAAQLAAARQLLAQREEGPGAEESATAAEP